ncbi:hypothetical protein BX070DRAFT_223834, partial [Coemansia spiralis]
MHIVYCFCWHVFSLTTKKYTESLCLRKKTFNGGPGYRSQCLSHAKRALSHL